MRMKEESEKAGLKLNIQKTKIMAFSPITSWQIEGEEVETVADFIFLCSEITVAADCSHKVKRQLCLRRKAVTNLDSVLKSKDITLPTKIRIIKAMVFPWWASLVAQTIKRLPAMQETRVRSLVWKISMD